MKHEAQKIAAAYVRVSSESQRRQQTIESQLEAVLTSARERGWTIAPELIFTDNGYSGASLDRPGLDAVRDQVAQGALAYVLALSPDRVSRKFAYQVLLQEEFERYDTKLVFVEAPEEATPQQVLLRQILSVLSEYERAQMAERSRRGKIYRARQGSLNMISRPPYGYDLIRKTETCGAQLVINAAEAAVVRLIFSLYIQKGGTMTTVTRKLRALGYVPRHGKHWSISTVAVILRNEAYIGRAAYQKTMSTGRRARRNRIGRSKKGAVRRLNGRTTRPREEWIILPVPAIVDEQTFQRAQAQRKTNRRFSPRNTRTPSLLQGLCVCAQCGYAMSRHAPKGRRNHYYRCLGTNSWHFPDGAVCDNPYANVQDLDEAVWNAVMEVLKSPDLIQNEIRRRIQAARDQGPAQRRMDELQKERTQCEAKSRRLIDAYQESLLSLDALRTRTGPLRTRQRAIESELKTLQAQELDRSTTLTLAHSVQQFLARMSEGEKALSITERQQLIRLLVSEVRVGKTDVTVCHCIPLTPSADPDAAPGSSPPPRSSDSAAELLIPRCGQIIQDERLTKAQQPLRIAIESVHKRFAQRIQPIAYAVQRTCARGLQLHQLQNGGGLHHPLVRMRLTSGRQHAPNHQNQGHANSIFSHAQRA